MRDSRHPIIAALLAFSGSAHAQDAYLCIGESAAGVSYSDVEKKWKPTIFSGGEKYLIRSAKPGEKWGDLEFKVGFYKFGEEQPRAFCQNGFNEAGSLFCEGIFLHVSMSKKTLRFQSIYTVGYVLPYNKEGTDTPAIQIGTCSPL